MHILFKKLFSDTERGVKAHKILITIMIMTQFTPKLCTLTFRDNYLDIRNPKVRRYGKRRFAHVNTLL